MRIALCLVLAGCNSIVGNRDFTGPDAGSDAGSGTVDCASLGMPPTTLTGTVFAPNQTLPIYNALVYVPTAALDDIPDGPSGRTCASGAPSVTAYSDTRGNFKLENVPAGSSIPLVIQVGKWRRAVTVASVPACSVTPVDPALTHLPRDRSEGHIPRIAIATGRDDSLECLARDLGIADSEIGSTDSSARVMLYGGNGTRTFAAGGSLTPSGTLTQGAMMQYDAVLFGCSGRGGDPNVNTPGAAAMFEFTNRGGWLWLSHEEFEWLRAAPDAWKDLCAFQRPPVQGFPLTLTVDTGVPGGQAFSDWLVATGASTTPGRLDVPFGQFICEAANPSQTRRLLYSDPETFPADQLFTWEAAMGGRLVFSDLHIASTDPMAAPYPGECTAPPAHEKAMLFQLFDTPTCLP